MIRAPALRSLGRHDVQRLFSRGRRFSDALGRVVWLGVPSLREAAVLFVVSRAVAKKSTVRNRLRRQLREAYRREWQARPFPATAMVSVTPAAARLTSRGRSAAGVALARRLALLVHRV